MGVLVFPKELFFYPGLTPSVFKTLLALMSFAYGSKVACWPSYAALAKVTGFSERTVIRHLGILVKQGFVEKLERPGHTTLYTIVIKKFSPDIQKSMGRALATLHPMLKRKTTNKDWQTLIRNERELLRLGK